MIKLGIDVGESKIRAEAWSVGSLHSESSGSFEGCGFPPYIYCEPLADERKYDYSPEELSFRVGTQAWTALLDREGRKKVAGERAWFIPSVKGLLLSRYPKSQLFLRKVAEQVRRSLNSGVGGEIETFAGVPVQADFFYRQVISDSFESSGLSIRKMYDEPLCLLAGSGLLEPKRAFSGRVVTVDHGSRNLSLASFALESVPGHRCDLALIDYLVEPGVGGDFLDKKILADLGGRNRHPGSENVCDQLAYLCLVREKREELAKANSPSIRWKMNSGQDSECELTSERVEELMEDLCDRAVSSLEKFLDKDKNRNPEAVILSGGLSYHPAINNCLEKLLDPPEVKWIGSPGVVARGALQVGLAINPKLNYQKELSIGVGTPTGKFFGLIDRSELPRNVGEELNYKKMLNLKCEDFPTEGLELDAFLGLSEFNTGNIPLARQLIRPDDVAGSLPVSLAFSIGIKKEKDRYQGSLTVLPEHKSGAKANVDQFVFWFD